MTPSYAEQIARAVYDFTDCVDSMSDADCRFVLHTLGRLARIDPESPDAMPKLVGIVMDLAAML